MKRSFVALAVLCSSLAACEGLDPPATQGESFALDVDPGVVYNTDEVRIHIMEDRIWLQDDATAQRQVVEHLNFSSPAQRDTTVTHYEAYRYSRDGAAIELTAVCAPNALCIAGPHLWGQMTSEGMELRWFRDPEVLLSYQRLNR